MPSDNPARPHLNTVFRNEQLRVVHMHLPPGAVLPAHREETSYLMHPRVAGKLRKTVYEGDKVIDRQEHDLSPDQPYFVSPLPKGQHFECENIGGTDLHVDKYQILNR